MQSVKTEKKRPKWLIPLCAVGGVLLFLIILLIIAGLRKPKSNFYDTLDTFVAQEKCNFRYVIDVRTAEHGTSSGVDLEKYMDDSVGETPQEATKSNGLKQDELAGLDNDIASDTTKPVDSHRTNTGNLYSDRINIDWTTADGAVDVNWNYPNFELIITGRVESTDPLEGAVSLQMATPYTSEEFCNLIFTDNKCYVDVRTLRTWLLNSHDANLVQLASQVPDSMSYIEIADEELNFVTPYAEIGEEEYSGAVNAVEQYRRFMIIEKILSKALSTSLGARGITSDGNKCNLSLSGEDALQLITAIKSIISRAPAEYDTYVQTLSKNNLITDNQKMQLDNEKNNFLEAVSNKWVDINSMSDSQFAAMELNVLGKTNKYNASTGGAVIEVNLGTSFTLDNIDYVITVYGCKQDLSVASSVKLGKPSETVVKLSEVNSEYNLHAVREYLKYYFKLTPDVNKYQRNPSFENIETKLLENFISLVNEENSKLNGGLGTIDIYSINSYIARFSEMTASEAEVNAVMKMNYDLVKKFKSLISAIGNIEDSEVINETASTVEETPEHMGIDYKSDIYDITGELSEEDSTSQLQVIVLDVKNNTDSDLTLPLSKWYVIDKSGNKYPCNYRVAIKGMDFNYDTSDVLESLEIKATETESVKLYIVMPPSQATLYSDTVEIGMFK